MDMGDVLKGDIVDRTVTITNTGLEPILTSQLFAYAACSFGQMSLQPQRHEHRWSILHGLDGKRSVLKQKHQQPDMHMHCLQIWQATASAT